MLQGSLLRANQGISLVPARRILHTCVVLTFRRVLGPARSAIELLPSTRNFIINYLKRPSIPASLLLHLSRLVVRWFLPGARTFSILLLVGVARSAFRTTAIFVSVLAGHQHIATRDISSPRPRLLAWHSRPTTRTSTFWF